MGEAPATCPLSSFSPGRRKGNNEQQEYEDDCNASHNVHDYPSPALAGTLHCFRLRPGKSRYQVWEPKVPRSVLERQAEA